MSGGLFHGLQLWVNLPREKKFAAPRYQDITAGKVALLTTEDGGALVRVIAGEVGGHTGPGSTYTPITLVHATVAPGATLVLPWRQDFNALVYTLSGNGAVGAEGASITTGQLAVHGSGDTLVISADRHQDARHAAGLDVYILGGQPIREPVFAYGPFVMNTRQEVVQAFEDYQAGKLGVVPAQHAHSGVDVSSDDSADESDDAKS